MPDEQPGVRRPDQRDAYRPCGAGAHRPPSACSRCLPRGLRPFRVVKRYRGDRVLRGFVASEWCAVWRLQAGDVGWPNDRRG